MTIKKKNHFISKNQKKTDDQRKCLEEFAFFLPLTIYTIDTTGAIVDINRPTANLTGYARSDLLGKEIDTLFENKKEAERLFNKVLKKKFAHDENVVLLTKNNKRLTASISASIRKDRKNNIIGYLLAISDVSKLKTSQEKLEVKVRERTAELEETKKALMNILEDIEEAGKKTEEEKNRTLSIINNLADGLLVFDYEDKIMLINPRAEIFLKVQKKSATGKTLAEFSNSPVINSLRELLEKKTKPILAKEFRINDNLVLELSMIPIKDRAEKLGSLVILHDVTREKLIEKTKSEFVSLAAHQLRTPLSGIKWSLKMVLDGDLGELNKEQRDFLENTYKSNDRMIALVNNLLDVARIEEGRYLYNLTIADLGKITEDAVKSYEQEIKKKNLTLEFEKTIENMPKTRMDAEKVRIVIDNFLGNAIKFTPAGGKITVAIRYDEKEIELSVTDTGLGIPVDQQKNIFNKFFRATNIQKVDTGGAGLGLYISKNIIKAHGGKIWFNSEKENARTTFHFTLPIKK